VRGCTNSTAINYDALTTVDSGGCVHAASPVGCVAEGAINFDALAVADDGTCRFAVRGCTDSAAVNYVSTASIDSGSCAYESLGCTVSVGTMNYDSTATSIHGCRYRVRGCTDSTAANFFSVANVDSGTCEWYIGGCLAPAALNYNPNATRDDDSCIFPLEGCTDSRYVDYYERATIMRPGGCVGTLIKKGCTSAGASNFDSTATMYDGSCTFDFHGCMDSASSRYNSLATRDDGSCAWSNFGCTDSASTCYDSLASVDDGGCLVAGCLAVRGCTDWNALNYLSRATYDDGSCIPRRVGCKNIAALNFDPNATVANGDSCRFPLFGCMDSRAENYISWATADTTPSSCAIQGCTDSLALNFVSHATYSVPVGLTACSYPVDGCMNPNATNYNSLATMASVTCAVEGCTDSFSPSYSAVATVPLSGAVNGGCAVPIAGCTNPHANNYAAVANVDDGTCFLGGCMDSRARNYQSWAAVDTGSCDLYGVGCTFSEALNFMPTASHDSGTCIVPGCLDSRALNFDPLATAIGVICLEARPGCMLTVAANYDVSANVEVNEACRVYGCTDSTQLGYTPLATISLDSAVEGSCVTPVYGCAESSATTFNSAVNVHLPHHCVYPSPPTPPLPDEAVVLLLTTPYSVTQLDTHSTASTAGAFLTTASSVASSSASRRQLGQGTPAAAEWASAPDWRIEFPRRVAFIVNVSTDKVDLVSVAEVAVVTPGGDVGNGTELTFWLQPNEPTTAGYAALRARLESMANGTFLSSVLGVPIVSVQVALRSELSPPPMAPPPNVKAQQGVIASGVLVAIIVPGVLALLLLVAACYVSKERLRRRLAEIKVLPEPSQARLVQPLTAPEATDESDAVAEDAGIGSGGSYRPPTGRSPGADAAEGGGADRSSPGRSRSQSTTRARRPRALGPNEEPASSADFPSLEAEDGASSNRRSRQQPLQPLMMSASDFIRRQSAWLLGSMRGPAAGTVAQRARIDVSQGRYEPASLVEPPSEPEPSWEEPPAPTQPSPPLLRSLRTEPSEAVLSELLRSIEDATSMTPSRPSPVPAADEAPQLQPQPPRSLPPPPSTTLGSSSSSSSLVHVATRLPRMNAPPPHVTNRLPRLTREGTVGMGSLAPISSTANLAADLPPLGSLVSRASLSCSQSMPTIAPRIPRMVPPSQRPVPPTLPETTPPQQQQSQPDANEG